MTSAKMQSSHADNIAPLPLFSPRKTSRLRGPRPCSWLQTATSVREESEESWSWTCRQVGLSRASTICSRTSSDSSLSNQSSITSESSSPSASCIDDTESLPFDHKSSRIHKRRSQRLRPSGPRPPSTPHSPSSPVRPTLSVNTSLVQLPPVPLEQPVLPLDLAGFPHIAPTEPTTPAPQLPPAIAFSPSDILDWDTIFEVLALESNAIV